MNRTTSSLSVFQQIVTTLGALLSLFQTSTPISFRLCAAQTVPERRNQTGEGRVWTWNATNPYSPLSDFRNETDRKHYTVWPENNPDHPFRFPCEDRASKLVLGNFFYPGTGRLMQTVQYYDLGIVEYFRPYWIKRKPCPPCWVANKPLGWTPIYCERGDVSNLYVARALSTLFQGLQFGVIMVLIQQAAFVVLAILIPVYFQNRSQGYHKMAIQRLQCLNWVPTLVESLHLVSLAVVGYLLEEGIGHSGDWRAIAMTSLAFYYPIQTACAFVASFLRQCADSIESSHLPTLPTLPSGNNVHTQGEEEKKKTKKKKKKVRVEKFIGHVVVYVVVTEYLYLTDDEYQNFLIQVVFGVVTVAVTLTMITVIDIGVSSLWTIVKALRTFVRNIAGSLLWSIVKAVLTFVMS